MKIKFAAFLALIAMAFSSCDISDDNQIRVQLVAVGVTDVEIPDPFVFGQNNDIILRYNNPSTCHRFEGFKIDQNLNVFEVTVFTNFIDEAVCESNNLPTEQTLPFLARSNGTVVFKFFTGFDDNGEREFLEYEVDVQE